mgnify:CR=1 FL=1
MKLFFFKRFFELILINVFFLRDNRFNEIIKNIKEIKKNYILIELYLSNVLVSIFYVFVSIIYKKNFKIIFFYYSKVDNFFGNKLIKILCFSYIKFLKNKCHAEIINLYRNPEIYEIKNGNRKYNKINKVEDLINLKYKKIEIGKYIIQSYCRELWKEHVDVKDQRLEKYIVEAIAYINNINTILKNKKIKKLFISHSVFIRYGILCRTCNSLNVSNIYIFYPTSRLGKFYKSLDFLKLDSKHHLQIERYWNFNKDFNKLKSKSKILNHSKKNLQNRIYGEKVSKHFIKGNINPYSKNKIIKFEKNNKIKILIMATCFYDRAFFYRNALFNSNSYLFTKEILNLAKYTNFEWYIKPHPDGHIKNIGSIKSLKKDFPFLKILPKNISNLSFKKNNFKCMFSFDGSALHEFIYMGIPSYCVGENKQSAFNFGKPVKNFRELKEIVSKPYKKKKYDLKDIYKFNYIYEYQKSPDWKSIDFVSDELSLILLKNFNGSYYNKYKSMVILSQNLNIRFHKIKKFLKKI